ncbi:MAG: LacI family DNA-binding transcriptional regulator [Oscillospiraceae bacterium]|nr:LacI family DNA-binding transcriptional regulator [Oscillospiraceae bacterium]
MFSKLIKQKMRCRSKLRFGVLFSLNLRYNQKYKVVGAIKKVRVTAKDVAKRAGVSAATVSMILNGKSSSKFPERTCRRVIDACNELGYVRNGAFKSAALDDKVLVAITPTLSNLYYVHMVEAMQRRAKELGYSLLAFDTFREIPQETRIIQICSQFPFAGVFFLYPTENNMLLQQVGWSKPVIHIYDKGVHNNADILELDGFRVGTIIGEYLIKLGHERIAFITSTFETKQVTRIRRLEGLRSVYKAHDLNPIQSVMACSPELELAEAKVVPEGYELGYLMAKRLIERNEDVTAFVAVNDMIAIGVMDAIIDAGKRIPDDYSVCGCDNTSVSKYKGISLTSVESYARQSGREAVDILVRKIEGGNHLSELEDSPDGITRVEYFPKLIIRKSTGPREKKNSTQLKND